LQTEGVIWRQQKRRSRRRIGLKAQAGKVIGTRQLSEQEKPLPNEVKRQ
jgi:hypothetical protein